MNKLILLTSVAMFAINISESLAAWSDNCPSGTTAGTTCKTCGDDCAYTENSEHVATIYGSGIINYTWKNVNGKSGYYDANNNPSPFYNNTSITGVQFAEGSNFTSIGSNAFNSASSLTSITIPEGVTSIGSSAFFNASSLTSITLPDSVTSIGEAAFYDASSLESITLPDSVTSIGMHAFYNATGLTSITIPDSVTSIGSIAFYNASGLTEIIIPDSLTAEQITKLKNVGLINGLDVYCQGDTKTCKDALDTAGYSYAEVKQADSTRCSGKYIYDTTCRQRNENECNSVAKYYYNSSANNGAGQCQLLPKTESACTGANIEWNATDNRCVNKNYTPSQEANNSNTGGDDIGDISGDFNPADCYNKGQVPYDNKCWDEYPFARKRWTPAEASKWLHDGNDNFVVITFKK